ncbi:hydantoinase/oxoprolinase family protein [Bradyrhizobium sp. NP1]|uniref:hydantoinase/oxoprolinase family protein n=1 Tax=Bradyrhizobium sp. NP1 TaxID=3049772 RepID=UPI0025A5EA3E|nr:hydantoinase/oxoprolinase family protein [Bradyrhizobium sp. NP1]WJR76689.1 hydantoinase/oxoprolinase family protein [Bradyrhizobium sp. NP1]
MGSVIVGCDVGGTFTDLILHDPANGGLKLAKVPTTTANQAHGVLAALEKTGKSANGIDLFIHGTTATTNALLERKLAKCGLITTRGFRDVLELGRRTRPNPYGLIGTFLPVIPRDLRLEVTERMDAEGAVVQPISEDEVRQAARDLLDRGAEAVVIHFLHSYVNPAHELRAAELVREIWPNEYVSAGHQIIGECREYERGVTAAVNGSVQPILHRYLNKLETELKARGLKQELLVMQGNGGTASSSIVTHAAVHTVMSGPASGVIAAANTASAAGFPNVITYDMGGTSTDVALIQDGVPLVSSELEIEYAMPIHVPMVDVHTVGAGGGSIAHVNEAGLLQIGPKSAGAIPGPICFGRGGTEPTITDANLVLGRLNPNRLLGVENTTTLETVEQALQRHVGNALELSGAQAAEAVIRVANDKMAGAIRLVSLSRGHDPRDFVLLAFGGAGPLHAAALARELGIPKVLIPARPGLTNALGCLVADLRHDFVRTINKPLPLVDQADLHAVLEAHVREGREILERENIEIDTVKVFHTADMQFQGQTHILNVAITGGAPKIEDLHQAFAEAYWNRFRVALPEIKPVLANLHTAVIGRRKPFPIDALRSKEPAASVDMARIEVRQVWFEDGWLATPVFDRDRLPLRSAFLGPAILEQLDATTVVHPGDRVEVDGFGNVIIHVEGH